MGLNDVVSIRFQARDQFSRVMDKMRRSTHKFRTEMTGVEKATGRANRQLTAMGKHRRGGAMGGMMNPGMGIGRFGTMAGVMGLGYMGARMAQAGISDKAKLDYHVDRILSLGEGAEALEKQIRSVITTQRDFGHSVDETGQALFSHLSMMGQTTDALDQFNIAARGARGGYSSQGILPVVQAVNKTLISFPALAGDAKKALTLISVAAQQSDVDLNQLAGVFPRVAVKGGQVGMRADVSAAALGTLSTAMANPRRASTAFEALIRGMFEAKGASRKLAYDYGLPSSPSEMAKAGGFLPAMKIWTDFFSQSQDAQDALPLFLEDSESRAAFSVFQNPKSTALTHQILAKQKSEWALGDKGSLYRSADRYENSLYAAQLKAAEAGGGITGTLLGDEVAGAYTMHADAKTAAAKAMRDDPNGFMSKVFTGVQSYGFSEQRTRLAGRLPPLPPSGRPPLQEVIAWEDFQRDNPGAAPGGWNSASVGGRLEIVVKAADGTSAEVTSVQSSGMPIGVQTVGE